MQGVALTTYLRFDDPNLVTVWCILSVNVILFMHSYENKELHFWILVDSINYIKY